MSLLLAYLLPDPEHSAPARALLVASYLGSGSLWMRASRRSRQVEDSFWRWWLTGAALLLLLSLNKLLNVRLWLESCLRALAKWQGWYERREPAQFALAIVLPLVLAALTGVLLATRGRTFCRSHPLALVGWILLLLYLALRQTQEWKPAIHLLEAIRYYDWRLALEIAGIVFVVLAALGQLLGPASNLAGCHDIDNAPGK